MTEWNEQAMDEQYLWMDMQKIMTLAMGSTQQKIPILWKYYMEFRDECEELETKYERALVLSRERLEQFRSIIFSMRETVNRERFGGHDSSDSEPEMFIHGPDILQ